jgi:hypothetical protein
VQRSFPHSQSVGRLDLEWNGGPAKGVERWFGGLSCIDLGLDMELWAV